MIMVLRALANGVEFKGYHFDDASLAVPDGNNEIQEL